MKVLSCYIRSFGTLSDISIDFKDGLNQFLCDNGVGKTTLLAFIRAMLYGLDYKQGSSKFYERKHYLPWDSTDCGGSLVIQSGDKKYRIERSFAKKQTDDTFSLFDEDTLKESNDYGDDIGEKLLGVDKESFEKSLFFGQGSLETMLTTSLNAKMGNLSNLRDDMNRFDEAIKSIDKQKSELEKKSKTNPGKMNILEDQIKLCEDALEQIPVLESALRERKASIDEKKTQIEKLLEIKNELAEKIKVAGELKEKEGAINAKKQQVESLAEKLKEYDDFFSGKVPTEDEINHMNETERELIEKESRFSEIKARLPEDDRVSFLAEIFGGDEPATKEMIDSSKEIAQEITKLRAAGEKTALPEESEIALAEAREFFKNKVPTVDEISKLMQSSEEINKLSAQAEAHKRLRDDEFQKVNVAKEQKNIGYVIAIFAGVLLAVMGCLIGVLAGINTISIVLMIVSILFGGAISIFSIIFIIHRHNTKRMQESESAQKIADLDFKIEEATHLSEERTKACLDFIGLFQIDADNMGILNALLNIQKRLIEYERLEQLLVATKKESAENTDALAELTMELYTRLTPYGEKYGLDLFDKHEEGKLLSALSDDIKEYDTYLENLSQSKEMENDIKTISDVLDTFMNRYEWEENTDTKQRLLSLSGMLEKYNSTKNQLEEINKELEEFKTLDADTKEETLEELQEKHKLIDEDYGPLVTDKAKEEEELSRIYVEIDEKEEAARGLSALKEQREELKEKVSILVDTKKYLEQAKDDFLSVYMKPLREGMEHYTKKFLSDNIMDDIQITLDMDLSIKLNRKGKVLSGEYLSEGYKDLSSMCARFALIDVLYKGERPTFFMDDPFTNMDEDKIQKALVILSEISGDSQIIYLTCHESRTLKNHKTFKF